MKKAKCSWKTKTKRFHCAQYHSGGDNWTFHKKKVMSRGHRTRLMIDKIRGALKNTQNKTTSGLASISLRLIK